MLCITLTYTNTADHVPLSGIHTCTYTSLKAWLFSGGKKKHMLLQIKLNWSKGQDSQSSHQGFTLGWLFHLQTRTLGALRVAALWVGFDFGTQPVWPRHVSMIRWKLLFRSSKLLNTEWVSTRFSANAFKSIYTLKSTLFGRRALGFGGRRLRDPCVTNEDRQTD